MTTDLRTRPVANSDATHLVEIRDFFASVKAAAAKRPKQKKRTVALAAGDGQDSTPTIFGACDVLVDGDPVAEDLDMAQWDAVEGDLDIGTLLDATDADGDPLDLIASGVPPVDLSTTSSGDNAEDEAAIATLTEELLFGARLPAALASQVLNTALESGPRLNLTALVWLLEITALDEFAHTHVAREIARRVASELRTPTNIARELRRPADFAGKLGALASRCAGTPRHDESPPAADGDDTGRRPNDDVRRTLANMQMEGQEVYLLGPSREVKSDASIGLGVAATPKGVLETAALITSGPWKGNYIVFPVPPLEAWHYDPRPDYSAERDAAMAALERYGCLPAAAVSTVKEHVSINGADWLTRQEDRWRSTYQVSYPVLSKAHTKRSKKARKQPSIENVLPFTSCSTEPFVGCCPPVGTAMATAAGASAFLLNGHAGDPNRPADCGWAGGCSPIYLGGFVHAFCGKYQRLGHLLHKQTYELLVQSLHQSDKVDVLTAYFTSDGHGALHGSDSWYACSKKGGDVAVRANKATVGTLDANSGATFSDTHTVATLIKLGAMTTNTGRPMCTAPQAGCNNQITFTPNSLARRADGDALAAALGKIVNCTAARRGGALVLRCKNKHGRKAAQRFVEENAGKYARVFNVAFDDTLAANGAAMMHKTCRFNPRHSTVCLTRRLDALTDTNAAYVGVGVEIRAGTLKPVAFAVDFAGRKRKGGKLVPALNERPLPATSFAEMKVGGDVKLEGFVVQQCSRLDLLASAGDRANEFVRLVHNEIHEAWAK